MDRKKINILSLVVLVIVVCSCYLVSADNIANSTIILTDTDLLPRQVTVKIKNDYNGKAYDVKVKKSSGYRKKIALPEGTYTIQETKGENYHIKSKRVTIGNEGKRIRINTNSSEIKGISSGIRVLVRKNLFNIFLLILVIISYFALKNFKKEKK